MTVSDALGLDWPGRLGKVAIRADGGKTLARGEWYCDRILNHYDDEVTTLIYYGGGNLTLFVKENDI